MPGFKGYPFTLKSISLRHECALQDKCPQCGGELDTGWECNSCGFDARDDAYSPVMRQIDQNLKVKQ